MKKLSPFDFVKSINKKINYEECKEHISLYEPYLTNHALSAHADCVLLANEMNRYSDLPKNMQYDFYYFAIRKGNRYEPWLKKNKNETYNNLKLISDYYQISMEKARQVIDILRPDQLKWISEKMNKGGKV